jgi:PhnO protein
MENTALDFEKFRAIFRAQCRDEHYYCLICEEEKASEAEVCGMLNLRFEEQLHHAERIAEIMEFVVAPECRNKGLGSEILAQACEVARKHGCIQIEVACNQLRKDTHRFYQREGMKNYHYKFSMSLTGAQDTGNRLGR